METLDLNCLPLFIATAEAGSFTAAANKLGCTKTKISLNIRALEKQLGIVLFNRTTRKVSLTQTGEIFYQQCKPLLNRLDETINDASSDAQQLTGTLRISAPIDHAAHSLAPAVAEFAKVHPALNIDIRSGDKISDLVSEGIDVAIRMGWLKDSSLRAQKLGIFEQKMYASKGYLDKNGTPKHPSELRHHAWLEFTPLPRSLTWDFKRGDELIQVQMHSQLRVDNTSALRSLIKQGAGISVMADFHHPDDNDLVEILSDWQMPSGGIYAVYPPGMFLPARARSFFAFYRDWLTRWTDSRSDAE